MGVEGSLVPTDCGGGRGRRKSSVGEQVGDAGSITGGRSSEGELQKSTINPNSRVRRSSLVAAPASGSDVANQHGWEGVTKGLREQVKVKE